MTARTAFVIQIVLGTLFAIYGVFTDIRDVGMGVAVAAIAVIGYEFLSLEEQE